MGRLNYPRDVRKVKEGEEYVAMRSLLIGSKKIAPGDKIDVNKFTRLRLRQMVEWRRIVPRWYYDQQTAGHKPVAKVEEADADTLLGDSLAIIEEGD